MNHWRWIGSLTAAVLSLGMAAVPVEYAGRTASFDVGDGPMTPELWTQMFGNGTPAANRDFGRIDGGAFVVTHKQGKKVSETGFSSQPKLPPRQQYTLQFRIKYPENFQAGLHGKQLGFSGGKGYDGGRGEQARTDGDGWSVRLQFDSRQDAVTNQLYVYHSRMPGKYGDSLGTSAQRYAIKRGEWSTLRLKVTMQSSADAEDGKIEVWQDGQKRFDVTGVKFVSDESGRQIDRLRMEVFAGGGGEFPTADQDVMIDDIQWSDVDITP